MALPTHILLTYGYLLLFAWVLIEQLGAPLPTIPALLAAGALSAQGQLSLTEVLLLGLAACLIADSSWFFIGRRYGHHVLNLLCKMSMEPTLCVRRTQLQFGRRRKVTLLIAKFIPGVALLSAPVAGQAGMSYGEFVLLDGLGALMWLLAWLWGGRLFGDALKRDPSLLDWVGRFSGALLVIGIAGFIVARVMRRRVLLRQMAESRLEPEELYSQIQDGEEVYIVDLRHPVEQLTDPFVLPGAQRIAPDDLTHRIGEIPRDRDVILYCTCPNEETAAHTAMKLHKLGVERVRPLRGGYQAWKSLGYPMEAIPPVNPQATLVQLG
ncbi:VTT domain-containing protein [Occallatibacter riparius]|uniref:VTT domain-containing protein n=1 Tax=Occallatibacter riparius TaxID=1002689 RepID=A0A9J7BHZ2_9BACT|nr:VTT domain-containing protein [Occallatibacter riparius]UWZ82121.1 VTT domain-containing protein [Occallatibacter riparius]